MAPTSPEIHSAGTLVQDVLLALFKHKWKIIICSIIGLVAATGVFFFNPPMYQSEAKLLLRYVVDRSAIDGADGAGGSATRTIDSLINSEVELLTSWDLAEKVVDIVGAERLLGAEAAKNPATKIAAAQRIQLGLLVTVRRGTNVIVVAYRDHEPELASVVLKHLVELYLDKHLKVHRTGNAELVKDRIKAVSSRLEDAESKLRTFKQAAGIISLNEGASSLTAELARSEEQFQTAKAELAEQRARILAMGGTIPPLPAKSEFAEYENPAAPSPATEHSNANPPPAGKVEKETTSTRAVASNRDLQAYRDVLGQLSRLREAELVLKGKYRPGNRNRVLNESQIKELEHEREALEEKFPEFAERIPAAQAIVSGSKSSFEMEFERARFVGLYARTQTLQSQMMELQARRDKFGNHAAEISRLERDKAVDEENYKYFSARVEKSEIDATLKAENIPNISKVQEPSPAMRVTIDRNKAVAGFALGGIGFGVGIALLIELLLNRTVKRPLELESRLRIPLFLSIPYFAGHNGRRRLPGSARPFEASNDRQRLSKAPWDPDHFLRLYFEAIRDRLNHYFEIKGIRHKPKLVGVTGFGEGAGTSVLAGGLAAALSETGDGKVLLVDMNVGDGEVHQFSEGMPAYSLADAIESPTTMDSAAENLYLASLSHPGQAPVPLGLKRFFDVMPGLKASDFDYIVFDLPPVNQTSPTEGMASFMDKLLLVVEAEKVDRDVVRRGYSQLVSNEANISVIFNKARSYGPKWAGAEI